MTQTTAILDLLRSRGSLGVTDLEALDAVGTRRLAARIYDLRREGHDIRSMTITTRSGARIARYVLHEARQLEMAL